MPDKLRKIALFAVITLVWAAIGRVLVVGFMPGHGAVALGALAVIALTSVPATRIAK